MKKLEAECLEDIEEWRMIVRECSEEIQAQVDKKVEEIKASIVSEEVKKYLLLQETESAKAIIQCKYLENIEEAWSEALDDGIEEDPIPPPVFNQPSGPLHEPTTIPNPLTLASLKAGHAAAIQGKAKTTIPSAVLSPDSLHGVESLMHNLQNLITDDAGTHPASNAPIPTPNTTALPPDAPVKMSLPIVALLALPSTPLLPGLVELLNALQANITMAFTSQLTSLLAQMDQQDIHIQAITKPQGKGKNPAVATGLASQATSHDAPPHLPSMVAPGVQPDATISSNNPPPGEPMGPPLGPPPINPPSLPPCKNGPVPIPTGATRWASVVTNTNFTGQTKAHTGAIATTRAIRRSVTGGKKAGRIPAYLINTEITVMHGKGLKDLKREEVVCHLTPT
ncbi:hypothetical protein BJY52DRAFT_1190883 [Lactarius psammicola]|nr:hypothetical protein BJY52DRAFT_1190883 [Lactarius psammicola]